ncbi:MAG: hypothetical protein AB7I27_18140 [Bacteriovoracaceae bacterium]
MAKLNVVDFESFKELKELRKNEMGYRSYLETLSNSQLEIEVNTLLDEFAENKYDKDFFTRGKLILKEVTSRANTATKAKIEQFTKETLKLL